MEGIKRFPPLIREIFRGSAKNFATAKLPAKNFADAREILRGREKYTVIFSTDLIAIYVPLPQ